MKTQTGLRGCAVLAVWFFLLRVASAALSPGSLDETFELDEEPFVPVTGVFVRSTGDILLAPVIVLTRVSSDGSHLPWFGYTNENGFGIPIMAEFPAHSGKIVFYPTAQGLVRFDSNGRIDEEFHPAVNPEFGVHAVLPYAGKLLVCGAASDFLGYLTFLGTDGSAQSNLGTITANGPITAIAATTNRIYAAGSFTAIGGGTNTLIAALTSSGAFDLAFQSPFAGCEGCTVQALLVRPTGEVLIHGYFPQADGSVVSLIQLQANGTIDSRFNAARADGAFRKVFLKSDGKLVVVGPFSTIGESEFSIAARLNLDGSVDTSFVPPRFEAVEYAFDIYDAAMDDRGGVIVAGTFEYVAGLRRRFVARLNGDVPSGRSILHWNTIATAIENAGSASLSLTRSGNPSGACSVAFSTRDGTAVAGRDYQESTGRVRFASGETNKSILVPLIDNRVVDGSRTIELLVSDASAADLHGASNAFIVIKDDEVNNRVQFSAASFPVNETQSNAVIEVVRDLGSTGAVSVSYSMSEGTARDGKDFLSVNGTVDFGNEQFTNWFLVPIINTRRADGNRHATLRLIQNAEFPDVVLSKTSTATLVIFDDESPAVVTTPNESWLRAAVLGGGNRVRVETDGAIVMSGPIDLARNVTLDGDGHDVVLSGNNGTRLFNVHPSATLTLRHLTLANGFSTNAGAIWNDGTLVLIDCTFSNNIARGTDGTNGVDGPLGDGQSHDGTPGQVARGGAILNHGTTFVTNSVFARNAAIAGNGGKGGIGAFVTNYLGGEGGNGAAGASASGGAIYSSGFAVFEGCRFMSNLAVAGAGGLGNIGAKTNFSSNLGLQSASGSSFVGGDASGGGVTSLGTFVVRNSGFQGNTTLAGRGGDGAIGRTYSRNGGQGRNGETGGSAVGGALCVTQTGIIVNTSFLLNSTSGGDGGNGGPGGSPGPSWSGGAGGAAGHGGPARGGAIFATGMLPLTGNSFHGNWAQGGRGGDGGGGSSSSPSSGSGGAGAPGGDGGHAEGGAVVVVGGAVRNSMFFDNRTTAGSGGSGGPGGSPIGGRYASGGNGGRGGNGGVSAGGAIHLPSGEIEITDSTFWSNLSQSSSGGNGGTVPSSFYHSNFGPLAGAGGDGGDAGSSLGGAMAASGAVKLFHSSFTSNRVETGSAGSGANGGSSSYGRNGGYAGNVSVASGGAIWTVSPFVSTYCVYIGNSAIAGAGGNGGWGGGTSAYSIPSFVTLGREGTGGGLASGGAITIISNEARIVRGRFVGNYARGGAGGNGGSHASNHGNFGASPRGGPGGDARGGAIDALSADLLLSDCSVSRNVAEGGAGGVTGRATASQYWSSTAFANPGPNGGRAFGGAVSSLATSIRVTGSTMDENVGIGGIGGIGGARLHTTVSAGEGGTGGNAFAGALLQHDGLLTITNSTFYSNSAIGGLGGTGGANNGGAQGGPGGDALGGAIHSVTGLVMVVNASFAESFSLAGPGGSGGVGETNTTGPAGPFGVALGGTIANNGAEFAIVNSLFNHHAGNTNAVGIFVDRGNNISSDSSFTFDRPTSFNNVDPLVGLLSDNGGATRTLELLNGSPAIDAGNDIVCPQVDQRGLSRPYGAHCDIGAFEFSKARFSISGRVKNRDGVPGIVVTAGGASAVTAANGDYTIRNLVAGNYLVTPHFKGGEFSPKARSISVGPDAVNVNFVIKLASAELTVRDSVEGLLLRVAGLPLASYSIESSTNLLHWSPVMNVRMDTNGRRELVAITNLNEPQRFFRLR